MSTNTKNLTIVQMNDTHAYFDLHPEWFFENDQFVYRKAGGYARIATLLKEIRENSNDVLFCDNGDTLNGTMPAVRSEGEAVIPVLNELGIDAMTLHWEFGHGPETLIEKSKKLKVPMLADNVYKLDDDKRLFPASIVKEYGDLSVGIIGIASNIVDKTMPDSFSKGLRFTLGKDELTEIIRDLKENKKADLIVLLSHLGFPQDIKLVNEIEGIDVCLSGHTHNRLFEPVIENDTIVIQSGCHGSFLGQLDLEVTDGRITDFSHQLIEVSEDIEPDPKISKIIEQSLSPYKDELAAVVGETKSALNRATMLESTMDNFLLSAIKESTGAQMAFSNGWRYGAPIVPGPVTMNDLYNITPMDPPIMTADLTGQELLDMIEQNLERSFASDPYEQMGGFVKRSLGLKVYIKIENPKGHRIQALYVGDEPVKKTETYKVAYITKQGVGDDFGSNKERFNMHAIESMKAYLEKHSPVTIDYLDTYKPV
ncbi:2',3'-cyclic-nucleotide 2'-phosphodiesterase/5'-or 3'-nucleotidase, 5'-nucleotidase family [Alkalibacterium putridalgicola]|uniref:2',3'-cyclic-nucleotide 2'-phosphodiesterase/5'-or 3'-nucleotidase, 5'-nucleotidase family n=1 Tax=Alkalibacterium putridalgicola TaxID=426703 RepID=A0A1H7TMF9_9LACT|nr:bifunctional metallophosphatase/5'-nucleotidase [Alkalibacterium putridalgicola]GEK88202.1 bifunctional metallophosphatase/5'-nucleotidase [Alkalibacterium putridalgicola]SEL85961.1 2',3'-cyclic-nucleotide 2'-phosphodiesterase/5'-or 3'-nucleotidase, 5'-nucleotidase family [Alkalibacterium putridalgicola]